LQMEGEFDPIAANTPFARSVQMLAPEGRVTVQSDAMEAHEGESVKETAKTSDKKEAQKVFDSALELNELEENPADARVEISDQRTVRVVLDQELAVEVSQDGDAVDVVVEGAPDVTNDMRETAPEIASKLDESGLQLRDFSTRRESQEKSHSGTGGDQESASEVGEATPTETLARGRTVNVVA